MRVVLPFKLDGQTLIKGRSFPKSVADGSKDSVVIKVDGVPDGCVAKGYFKLSWESNTTYDLTFDGDELVVDEYIVTLPSYANNKYIDYKFSFSVAIWEGNVERLTTNPVEVVVEKSNYTDETTNTPEIPESQYDKLAWDLSGIIDLTNNLDDDVKNLTEKVGNMDVLVVTEAYDTPLFASHTSREINDHVKSGGSVVLNRGEYYFTLASSTPLEAIFDGTTGDGNKTILWVDVDGKFTSYEYDPTENGADTLVVTYDEDSGTASKNAGDIYRHVSAGGIVLFERYADEYYTLARSNENSATFMEVNDEGLVYVYVIVDDGSVEEYEYETKSIGSWQGLLGRVEALESGSGGGVGVTVDTTLDATSLNAIANKPVALEMELITSSMERRFIGNLINPATVVSGIILSNGTVQSDDRFRTTDFIAVTAGETLNFKAYTDNPDVDKFRFLAAYDENKNAVQSAAGTYVATYVVPDGISYIRGTIAVAEVSGAVLVSGELPAEYVPYVGETYLATEQFLEHIVYTKPQVDAKIAEKCEKQSVSIKTEINNDVDTKIAEATEELDEELSFAIDTLNNPDVPIPITFEQGGIDATTGQNTDVEKECLVRTAGYISAKCGDEIKISIVDDKHTYRVYKYSADGEFVERTAVLYISKTIEATENCFYRIQCQAESGAVAPDFADDLIVTITTAIYKRNVSVKFDEAYVKETDKVIETALDETADIRLLCVGDPHSFDDYKYQKYDEIMGRGVVDYLVGLGDYVDYEDHGAKSNYRKLLLNAINKAGRERNRIYVTGNHDVSMRAGGVGASDIDLVMYPKDCFDVFYRHLKPCMVVDPEKPYGGYFYIDDAHSKIRLIVLNSNEIVNDDGSVTWYYEQSKISQRQLDWFGNTALKVDEAGWSVVVFLHNDTPYGFSGGNARALFDILSAAKNGASVNRTFTAYCRMVTDANGNATSTIDTKNGDTYTLNADFTNGHTVDVIGVVHGHTHEKDWQEYSGIKSISVRNDNGKHNDRYISKGTFARNTVYYFTTIHGHIYTFTAPDDYTTDNAVQFEYCAYHTQYGNNTAGYFVQADGNQHSVAITGVSSAPSGATEITGFVRERDGSLEGEESCEILCINKDARTITTVPYGTGTRRVISY